ncbi:MAG: DUF11 domain-containing protein [Euryarchaeota archaeon]|nr:DUF11 domain-containing protein [Euryarchaeota archaeon]MCG2738213.1 DUF11 domain-containing protein [Candidatus Methanoperedenaceae archaeon]
MKAVLFFIVLLNIITIASASEWEEHNAILKWGESVSVSGYNITAMDFRPGTVEEITNKTKCIIEPDPYKRKIWGCDDYVFLTVFKNGDHVLDAALTERNHTFVDGAEFFNETVYKEGDSSLKITALEVITGKYIPTPYAKLRILVKNNELELEFDIAGNFAIVKTVPAEAHVNPLSEFIPVSITVKNTGAYDFSYIWVNDSTPEGFISKPQEPGWGIPLKKGEIWQEEYLIKPLKPVAGKKYTLPPAALYVVYNNRTYNLSTGNISFILRSSEIIVTKTADKTEVRGPGNVTVNISVKNNGSRAAQVKVRDSIIPDMEVVSGELNFSIVLQPDGSYNNSYILKLNNVSDNISLPYARFDFKEYWSEYDPETQSQANTGSGISNPVEIKFGSTSTQEKASASTQENNTSSLAPPAEKPSTDDSSMEDSPNPSGEDLPAETMPSGILKKASSIWISIQQLPYAVLALMAGGLLAILMLRIWKPGKEKNKNNP